MTAVLNHKKSTEPSWNWNELIKSFAKESSNFQHRVSHRQQGNRSLDSPFPLQGSSVADHSQGTEPPDNLEQQQSALDRDTLNFILINFSLGLLVAARICWRKTGAHSEADKSSFISKGAYVHKTSDDPGDHGKQHDLCLTQLCMTAWIILTVGVIAGSDGN